MLCLINIQSLEKINKINIEKNLNQINKAKFSKNVIISNITNFYMTDSVSRNSPTMSSLFTSNKR